jgi:DNA primase large subunit
MKTKTLKVILGPADYLRYPFLREAIENIRLFGLTLEDIGNSPLGAELLNNARKKILTVIEKGYYPTPESSPGSDYRIEVASFLTTLIILSEIGDEALNEKFAIVFSKCVASELSKDSIKKAIFIAVDTLGWHITLDGNECLLHYKHYLHGVPEYAGEWKLINRPVSGGFVRVPQDKIFRIVETGIKKHVLSLIEKTTVEESKIPERLYKVVEEIATVWSNLRSELAAYARKAYRSKEEELFPPCIRSLLKDLSSGKNLTHVARFALASFLLNIGFNVDEVLEVFRLSPDFREDIARYQIEHIAGLRGSRTKYLPYKCENMRSYGLCMWRCENVRHPLQYFFRAARGRTPRVAES